MDPRPVTLYGHITQLSAELNAELETITLSLVAPMFMASSLHRIAGWQTQRIKIKIVIEPDAEEEQ